jgi:hypothetical protein
VRIINLSIPIDISSVVEFGGDQHAFSANIQMRIIPTINSEKLEYLIDCKIDSVDFDASKMTLKDAALIEAIDNFNFCRK